MTTALRSITGSREIAKCVCVCARAHLLASIYDNGESVRVIRRVTAQHNRLPDWCNLYIFCHYRQKFSRIHFSPFLNSQFVYFRSFFITWLIIWHKIRWQQAFPARDRTDLPVYLFWNVHVCFQWGWWWYYKFGLKSNFVIYLDNETISTKQRSIIPSSPRRLPSPSTFKFLPQMHSGGEKE